MKASVVTFAQLPEDEAALLAYLAKTGDVWARAASEAPDCKPSPAADFIPAHSARLTSNGTWDVYLGFRADVLAPTLSGDGSVDPFRSRLLGYRRGDYHPGGELAQSNLFFYCGWSSEGDTFLTKPEAFLKWARKVLGWARRYAPERVPVYRCNYRTRGTARVADAVAGGLKVWY